MRGGKKSVLNNQQFSCFCFLYIESHARQLITFVRMADEWLGLNCDGKMRSETRIDFSFRRSLLARPFSGGHDGMTGWGPKKCGSSSAKKKEGRREKKPQQHGET